MNISTQQLTISIPITESNRKKAKQFAGEQSDSEKSLQVYHNTLAVLATNNYLQMLDVSTSLQQSHSWNAVARVSTNIADLNLPGKGHLECRPILDSEDTCYFPKDIWNNRIGYVVVQLDQSYKRATLLGFVPQVSSTKLDIKQLQSLDDLFVALHSNDHLVQLSQWLENIVDEGWKSIEAIIGRQAINPMFVFADISSNNDNYQKIEDAVEQLYVTQNEINKVDLDSEKALIHLVKNTSNEEIRWKAAELLWEINPENPNGAIRKAVDLGMHFGENAIALMVAILPKPDGSMAILVRVYPGYDTNYLPQALQLSGLDATGNSFFTVTSRNKDNYIQFKFTAELGDKFNIKLALDNASITESFVI
ncbi:Protein of unknown function (DUF1822) [Rivularia sp. PCC 7116]|uniref:DUF1822 family protein n=1 Tax=Rivularia sp. PCC 7116 TaxID=373994 RepID=UPI00029ED9D5|nr:DUF1822 family protein [Rivularia sp. PCC 7116]AFY59119.1 Protein of unknown function (DUF1822) [Rivularia sp. PCC 7116]